MNGLSPEPCGLLLLDKPEGITSHTAVKRVARCFGVKRAGHAGTLDPLAKGLLLVGVGRATRLLEYLVGLSKSYRAVVRFGMETDTLDREGREVYLSDAAPPERERMEEAIKSFVGVIEQVPPVFSAIKVGGVPLHRKARRKAEVTVPSRNVEIHGIRLIDVNGPDATIDVDCGSGTYIRSLARDLGRNLGTFATLWDLIRTRSGPFALEDAIGTDALGRMDQTELAGFLKGPEIMVEGLPKTVVGETLLAMILNGRAVPSPAPVGDAPDVAVFDDAGRFYAICSEKDGVLMPKKVLAELNP